MVKQDKLSVDKTGNTHNHESEMDHSKPEAAASSDQGPFSSDPFAANYRTVVDLNDPKVLATFAEFEALTGLRFTRKQRQILHSVEWTERMRPTDQLTVILKVSNYSYSSWTGSLAVMDRSLNTSRNGVCWRDIQTSLSETVLPMRGSRVCKVSFTKKHQI